MVSVASRPRTSFHLRHSCRRIFWWRTPDSKLLRTPKSTPRLQLVLIIRIFVARIFAKVVVMTITIMMMLMMKIMMIEDHDDEDGFVCLEGHHEMDMYLLGIRICPRTRSAPCPITPSRWDIGPGPLSFRNPINTLRPLSFR